MERSKQVFLTTAKLFYLENIDIHLPSFVIIISLCFLFSSPSYSQEGVVYEKIIQVGEIEREYLLYIPSTYSGQEVWPLVLNFHGFNSDPAQQMAVSQMNNVADAEHFLVAYPQGLIVQNPVVSGPGPGWNLPGVEAEQDDVAFVDALINQVDSKYNISLSRIHVTGWSMGANMSFLLACALSDRIASASGVGGPIPLPLMESCYPNRLFSVLSVHGTSDPIVPYEGVPNFIPSAEVASEFWASQNNCNQEPILTELSDKDTEDGSTVSRFDYPNCDEDAEVILYRINNGGHTWPGGGLLPEFLGNINRDINASAIIWDFFERHPYPDPFVPTLTLVNAKSDEDIQVLEDGDLLDLSELPKAHLNIRAEVYGGVRSVKFELNDEEVSIENFEPYAMFGDQDGDYRSGRLKPGDYVLKVTPYTAPNAKGDAAESLEINIKVVRRNTVADVVKRTSDFSALLKALRRSGLLSKLDSEGPYTLFAPDNVAFLKAFKVLGINDIEQIPDFLLMKVLMYHLVHGKILATDISDGQEESSLSYLPLSFRRNQEHIYVNNAYITKADQQASNGVVHAISDIIIPDINAFLFGLEALLDNEEDASSLASRNTQSLKVLASPNPGAREITVITHGMMGKRLTVTIMNYSGLQTKKIEYDLSQKEEETTLDFTNYSKGMYIIHAQVGHLQRYVKVMH